MVKIVKKTSKLEENMNGKLGKTKEIEETAGKKFWKNRRNTGKGLKKGMKWRQGKALKKLGT